MAITEAPEPLKQPVPDYRPSLERLYSMLGMRDDRIAQLEARILEIAGEANEWHDRFISEHEGREKAERECESLRQESVRHGIRKMMEVVGSEADA